MTKNGNGKKIEHRITSLEVKVDTILTNHLPHLDEKVDKIASRLMQVFVLAITSLASLVTGLLFIILKG